MLGRPGVTRKPYASHKPHKIAHAPVKITLTCTLNPTPNLKPRLNASSKPKAEHEPSTLTNLALVDRSKIPFNSKPQKTQQLKLNPKPQNPTTTPQGEERPHTPHHRKGVAPPISRPLTFGGGGGGGGRGARDHIYIYTYIYV